MERADDLMDFAFFALDHAADSVIASGGPLTPFAITEVDGERVLARFVAELAEAQQHARRSVASSANALKAAVAWDGYLTVGGERTDAVFVEASAAGDQSSIILAERYRSSGRLRKKLERVGNAAVVGDGQPLF